MSVGSWPEVSLRFWPFNDRLPFPNIRRSPVFGPIL